MTITLPRLRFLAPLFAASATAASMTAWVTRGRAPSWTAMRRLFLLHQATPFWTDSVRVLPPTMTALSLSTPASRSSVSTGSRRSARVTTTSTCTAGLC